AVVAEWLRTVAVRTERRLMQKHQSETCTPAMTATSTAIRGAAGRNTTAAAGTASRNRHSFRRSVSWIAIRSRATRGCCARTTGATSAPAAASAATASGRAALASVAAASVAAASVAVAGAETLRYHNGAKDRI